MISILFTDVLSFKCIFWYLRSIYSMKNIEFLEYFLLTTMRKRKNFALIICHSKTIKQVLLFPIYKW